MVDICYDNTVIGGSSTVASATTAFTSSIGVQGVSGACTATSASSATRPLTQFVNSGTDVTATLNWVWNPGALSGSTVTVNPTSTTIYTVTATNPTTGCTKTSGPVTVNVTPVGASATATPSTPICVGTSVTLNGTATGGGPFSYAWDDGTVSVGSGTTVTGVVPSLVVTPTVTTTYTLTILDNCGNQATATKTVTVNPLPTASIQETGPITLCSPATQVLTAVTNAATPTYQWTLNGTNISGATGSTYTVTGVGTGLYESLLRIRKQVVRVFLQQALP